MTVVTIITLCGVLFQDNDLSHYYYHTMILIKTDVVHMQSSHHVTYYFKMMTVFTLPIAIILIKYINLKK